MTVFTILTLIFITLKLIGSIDWSWWFVLAPTIIYCLLRLAIAIWWESKTPEEKMRHAYKKWKGL